MYSTTTVTVEILNAVRFERYFLDYTSGQAAVAPDTFANVLTAVVPSLPSAVFYNLQARIFGGNEPSSLDRKAAEDACKAAEQLAPNTKTTDVTTLATDYANCFGASPRGLDLLGFELAAFMHERDDEDLALAQVIRMRQE
jgi:hypothetical protein